MIDRVHVSHNGIESTLKLARENIFWPGMSAQIMDVVKECTVCAKYAPSQQKPPMQSHAIPVYPWQIVILFDVKCKCALHPSHASYPSHLSYSYLDFRYR